MTLLVDDSLPTDEVQGAEDAASSIYAVKLGRQCVIGLQNSGIQVERIDELETRDATRTRINWYTGLALIGTLGLARLQGINED